MGTIIIVAVAAVLLLLTVAVGLAARWGDNTSPKTISLPGDRSPGTSWPSPWPGFPCGWKCGLGLMGLTYSPASRPEAWRGAGLSA